MSLQNQLPTFHGLLRDYTRRRRKGLHAEERVGGVCDQLVDILPTGWR